MRRFFDLQVDFFLPVWRRLAVVAVCFAWGILEFVAATPFWGIIFFALGVLATWQLFFDGWPESSDSGANAADRNRSGG